MQSSRYPATRGIGEKREYLERHGLWHAAFPTRARAVDVVRLALAQQPFPRPEPRTAWVKQAEGEYLSRDGHWLLQRTEPLIVLFSPVSKPARRAAGDSKFLCRGRWSLYACALYADDLNLRVDLDPKLEERSPLGARGAQMKGSGLELRRGGRAWLRGARWEERVPDKVEIWRSN